VNLSYLGFLCINQSYLGGVAIEDSASICALFPRNTTKEEVTERLALYERIRDERAHRIQAATRSLGTDLDENKANNTDNSR
jgi:hypothetical protein